VSIVPSAFIMTDSAFGEQLAFSREAQKYEI
jgi:hypothetical protein